MRFLLQRGAVGCEIKSRVCGDPLSQSYCQVTQVRGGKWNHRAGGQPGTKTCGDKVEDWETSLSSRRAQ